MNKKIISIFWHNIKLKTTLLFLMLFITLSAYASKEEITREEDITKKEDIAQKEDLTQKEEEQEKKTVNLDEIVVEIKRPKYSKKNNPAVEFARRLRKDSKKNDPFEMDFYSYDKYEKTIFALNDYNSKPNGKERSGKLAFLENYTDTSSLTGKRILDLLIKEKISTRLRSRNPGADKEVTRAYRSAGIDEVMDQDNVRIIIENALPEIDIFRNDINLLQNRFVSPLSTIGPDFYMYFLRDTVIIDDEKCIELGFRPHNTESLGFIGNLYVPVEDTTMFVKKIIMKTPSNINLNYVDGVHISQTFEKDSLGKRHKKSDDISVEFRLIPGTPGIYSRKISLYDRFSYDMREDLSEYYRMMGKNFSLENSLSRDTIFWSENRPIALSFAEGRLSNLTKEMRKVPVLYWGEKVVHFLEDGFLSIGKKHKFDLGPVTSFISFNPVEGLRLKLGGMTMASLNPHFFGSAYVSYGLHDRKWRYSGKLEYSFKAKKNHSNEWPRHGIWLEWNNDMDMIGQHYLFSDPDNIFLSFKRKKSVLVTYRKEVKLGYILELPNNFSVEFGFKYEHQKPSKWLPFVFSNGEVSHSYNQSAFALSLRWAPGEQFVQRRFNRINVNKDGWVIIFTQEYGPKRFCGSSFTMNRSELSIRKRLWLSAFGYFDFILKGGKIWSSVYYPALMWPNANITYTIQQESFSLMNPMEFANDTYTALDISYYGRGVLFNHIPWLKKLHLREIVTFKGLYGTLTDRNNPSINKDLYQFPADAKVGIMGHQPYMEMGVGIDNILTLFRLDYVWRLTYRGIPGCDDRGLRIGLHVSF